MKHSGQIYLLSLIILLVIGACTPDTPELDAHIVAKIGNAELTENELDAHVPDYYSGEDSAEVAARYIQKWIEIQLLYQKALEELKDSVEIAQKIQEYRMRLFIHAYEEDFISRHLDTLISYSDVNAYYKEHMSEFLLNVPVVKAHYMIMERNTGTYYRERYKIRHSDPDNMDLLYDACKGTNKEIVEIKEWLPLHTLLNRINYSEEIDINQLETSRYIEAEDSLNRHLVKVNDIRKVGDTVPLGLISKKIVQILLNKRKQQLMDELKKDLFENAKSRKEFVIHEK